MLKKNYLSNYSEELINLYQNLDLTKFDKLYSSIKSLKKNSKILIFGNGAGASISSHFANDISNSTNIKALSFDNSAHLTCFANDYGFENWVKKTIEIFAQKGDLIILISASGESENMIRAAKFCKFKKIKFFSLTGFKKNNRLNKNSNQYIWVDSKSYNKVELTQLLILLSIVDRLNVKN
tara:strand:+ start:237 stop:779 length:543 start_codon:yes stop_codon:yes gene_type:complete